MKIVYYKLEEVRPNPWNPNRMNPREFESEIESIMHFGFIDPVTVRENDGPEIIDGAHRVQALGEIHRRSLLHPDEAYAIRPAISAIFDEKLGWHYEGGKRLGLSEFIPPLQKLLVRGEVPCVNLGKVPDAHAKKLTIVLNETRGRASQHDLAALLRKVSQEAKMSIEELQFGLPYREQEMQNYLRMGDFEIPSVPQILKQSEERPKKRQEDALSKLRDAESRFVCCPECGVTFVPKRAKKRRR